MSPPPHQTNKQTNNNNRSCIVLYCIVLYVTGWVLPMSRTFLYVHFNHHQSSSTSPSAFIIIIITINHYRLEEREHRFNKQYCIPINCCRLFVYYYRLDSSTRPHVHTSTYNICIIWYINQLVIIICICICICCGCCCCCCYSCCYR